MRIRSDAVAHLPCVGACADAPCILIELMIPAGEHARKALPPPPAVQAAMASSTAEGTAEGTPEGTAEGTAMADGDPENGGSSLLRALGDAARDGVRMLPFVPQLMSPADAADTTTMLIIASDHGMLPHAGHGASEAEVRLKH